jgi:hypothetical protein
LGYQLLTGAEVAGIDAVSAKATQAVGCSTWLPFGRA